MVRVRRCDLRGGRARLPGRAVIDERTSWRGRGATAGVLGACAASPRARRCFRTGAKAACACPESCASRVLDATRAHHRQEPASSARHFAERLAADGRRRRRARQADLLRQPREPRRRAGVELVEADICDRCRGRGRRKGCEAVVNFAAETHVDRSIHGASEFIRDRRAGHARPARLGARERARGSCRSRRTRCYGDVAEGASSREDDQLRPSSPYSASKAGGDLQVLAAVRTYGVDAVHHARLEHVRAEPVPGEDHPALRHQRARRRAAAAVRRRPPDPRLAPRRGPLRRRRARRCRGSERRDLQRRRRRRRSRTAT